MSDSQRRILVVEDEPAIREIIVSFLREGYSDVCEAENGAEALKLLRTETFELVLSDINMPVMDGVECFTRAKGLGIQTPFVFVTAFSDADNMLKALRLGAFDFVRKPFHDHELLAVVDRAVEVGFRKNQIFEELKNVDSRTREKIVNSEKLINLLEVNNHRKRA